MYTHTHTHKVDTATTPLCRVHAAVTMAGLFKVPAAAAKSHSSCFNLGVCITHEYTHIDACGVKGALVSDAGVAYGIGEAAVSQQAPPAMNDGPHHRHQESDG